MPRLLPLLAVTLFASCPNPTTAAATRPVPASRPPVKHSGTHSPAQARRIIAVRARAVVRALKRKDWRALSGYVHPRRGLRFSAYVAPEKGERVFSRRQVVALGRDSTRYLWGSYDGTGDPIRLTPAEYYKRFVYDRDFAAARSITYNTPVARGNTLNRLPQTYPGAILVEYHLPGKGEIMDWKSLWLVWQKHGTRWYLSGIAHGEWTI